MDGEDDAEKAVAERAHRLREEDGGDFTRHGRAPASGAARGEAYGSRRAGTPGRLADLRAARQAPSRRARGRSLRLRRARAGALLDPPQREARPALRGAVRRRMAPSCRRSRSSRRTAPIRSSWPPPRASSPRWPPPLVLAARGELGALVEPRRVGRLDAARLARNRPRLRLLLRRREPHQRDRDGAVSPDRAALLAADRALLSRAPARAPPRRRRDAAAGRHRARGGARGLPRLTGSAAAARDAAVLAGVTPARA